MLGELKTRTWIDKALLRKVAFAVAVRRLGLKRLAAAGLGLAADELKNAFDAASDPTLAS